MNDYKEDDLNLKNFKFKEDQNNFNNIIKELFIKIQYNENVLMNLQELNEHLSKFSGTIEEELHESNFIYYLVNYLNPSYLEICYQSFFCLTLLIELSSYPFRFFQDWMIISLKCSLDPFIISQSQRFYKAILSHSIDLFLEYIFNGNIIEGILSMILRIQQKNILIAFFQLLKFIYENIPNIYLFYDNNNENIINIPINTIYTFLSSTSSLILFEILNLFFLILQNWRKSIEDLIPNNILFKLIEITQNSEKIDPSSKILYPLSSIFHILITQLSLYSDESILSLLLTTLISRININNSPIKNILYLISSVIQFESISKIMLKNNIFKNLMLTMNKFSFSIKEFFLIIFCKMIIFFPNEIINLENFNEYLLLTFDYIDDSNNEFKFLFLKVIWTLFSFDKNFKDIFLDVNLEEKLYKLSENKFDLGFFANNILNTFFIEEIDNFDKLFC